MTDSDQTARSALDPTLETLRGELLRVVADAESRAASTAADAAAARAREEFDREKETLHRRALDEQAALQRVIEALGERHAQEAAEADERLAGIGRELESARQALAEREQAAAETTRQRDDALRQAEDQRHDAEERRRERDEARRLLEEALTRTEAAERQAEDARGQAVQARRERDLVGGELAHARQSAQGVEDALAQMDRLPGALRTLDAARSLGDVLSRLVDLAGREAGRAVVYLVKGDRLEDWRATGFAPDGSQAPTPLAIAGAGLLGAVVHSATSRERAGEEGPALPPFAEGDGPRHALGVPVVVGGTVIAVLYADARAGGSEAVRWPALVDVLARHTGRVLEAMTVRHAAALWTRGLGPERLS